MRKRRLRYIFLGFLTLAALGFMGLCAFAVLTLSQVPLEKLERISPSAHRTHRGGEASILESGGVVRARELRTFYTFSGGKVPFSQWRKKRQVGGKLQWRGGNVEVKEKLKLPKLLANDCLQVYCFQHRIAFDRVPSVFWKGLIGIEDYRFLDHFGIDLQSIARALIVDIREMSLVQGGSTLTQQLVKNLFFTNEKTFERKLKEIVVAIYIESLYSKESILEAYFNELNWGSFQGIKIKGVYSASLFYFNKSPQDISPFEASILIGLLKGPYYYHPLEHPERLRSRTELVFNKLIEQGFYSKDVDSIWSSTDWKEWRRFLEKRSERTNLKSMWHLYQQSKSFLSSYEEYVLIRAAKRALKTSYRRTKDRGDLAVKIFLRKTKGEGKEERAAFKYYSKAERPLEQAMTEERHQVGSTLKPIIYREFLARGKKLDDKVSTEPLTLKLKSGEWSPDEAAGHEGGEKEITLNRALLRSYNRPVIHLARDVGFAELERGLKDYFPRLKTPLKEYPAQLLGAIELSVVELSRAYGKFIARECADKEPTLINLLSDPTRTTIKNVVSGGLSKMLFLGKTGTSNKGYDNWFVFFNGDHTGVIWLGHEGARGEDEFPLFGSVSAYPVFQHFFQYRGKRFPQLGCDKLAEAP